MFSFTKKINWTAIAGWIALSLAVLVSYPTLRGQSLLNVFYAYYLVCGGANLIYLLSKAKQKFTFSQGGLLLGTIGSIICILIAIKEVSLLSMDHWFLVTLCNCIFCTSLLVASWINRFVKKLLP